METWSWKHFYGHSPSSADSRRAVVSYWQRNVHYVPVNCLWGLPTNSVVRVTDRAWNYLNMCWRAVKQKSNQNYLIYFPETFENPWFLLNFCLLINVYWSQLMRLWYLSHRRPAKAQASMNICAVSPEPSLFAHITYGSRWRVRPKIRHLASIGWLCMRVWRMGLQRTKCTIIWWDGSILLFLDTCNWCFLVLVLSQ